MGIVERVTGFARTSARIDLERARPLSAVRRALVVVAAIALGWAVSGPAMATSAGTAAMLVGFLDRQQSPRAMLWATGGTTVLLAATTAVVTAVSPWPWGILLLLALIAFAEGISIAGSKDAPTAFHFAGILAATAALQPRPPGEAATAAMVVLLAGGVQALTSVATARFSPRIREVVDVADTLDLLASALDPASRSSPADPSAPDPALDRATRALAATQTALSVSDLHPAERGRMLRVVWAAERLRAVAKAASLSTSFDPVETAHACSRSTAALHAAAVALREYGTSRDPAGPALDDPQGETALDTATRSLLGAVRAVVSGPHGPRSSPVPWERTAERVRHAAAPGTTTFRLGLRLTLAVLGAMVVGQFAGLAHASWAAGAVLGILRPDSAATLPRVALRAVGATLGGALVVAIAAATGGGTTAMAVAMSAFVLLCYWLGPVNYGLFVSLLTASMLFIVSLTGADPIAMAVERWLDNLLGCAFAIAAAFALPVWKTRTLPDALARMIRSVSTWYAALGAAARPGHGSPGPEVVRRCGTATRDAVSDVVAVLRMSAVEPHGPVDVERLTTVFDRVREVARDALVLEHELALGSPAPTSTERRALGVAGTLTRLADAIEGRTVQPGFDAATVAVGDTPSVGDGVDGPADHPVTARLEHAQALASDTLEGLSPAVGRTT